MIKAAALQMASGSNLQGNLLEAERLIKDAVHSGANLLVLPENFGMITQHETDLLAFAESFDEGSLQEFLSAQAAQHGITLVGGSIPLKAQDSDKITNSTLVFDPQGNCIFRYDKIHLFDVVLGGGEERYHESSLFLPGDEVVVFDWQDTKVGLAICYDLRFPELFRQLVAKGAEIIVLPAAFTAETGRAHWHTLLRARAIENLAFVVAAAQGGSHVNGRETYGHSLLMDPWGTTLDEVSQGTGVAVADLNLERQRQLRERFPVLDHRKLV